MGVASGAGVGSATEVVSPADGASTGVAASGVEVAGTAFARRELRVSAVAERLRSRRKSGRVEPGTCAGASEASRWRSGGREFVTGSFREAGVRGGRSPRMPPLPICNLIREIESVKSRAHGSRSVSRRVLGLPSTSAGVCSGGRCTDSAPGARRPGGQWGTICRTWGKVGIRLACGGIADLGCVPEYRPELALFGSGCRWPRVDLRV